MAFFSTVVTTFLLWLASSQVFAADLVITGATLYAAPDVAVQRNATIVVNDGRITSVLSQSASVPTGAVHIDAQGRAVTAGLWNSHIHLTDPELATNAQGVLSKMLLRYGFTSVVDTGSQLNETNIIRAAIAAGKLTGPRILTANGSFVYKDGTPSYLPPGLLPELHSAAAASPAVHAVLDQGADGIKIFSGSFQAGRETIWLPPDIIHAISEAAHARDAWVYSHPTDLTGLTNAVNNGVDVLAHTAPSVGVLSVQLIATMIANEVSLVPTLKLWSWELGRVNAPESQVLAYERSSIEQTRQYFEAGGDILFGTDVGYMRDYSTRKEYDMLAQAGLDFAAVLATLTTNPADRFADDDGTVRLGNPADLVIYAHDPHSDIRHFEDVAFTIRAGQIVYQAEVDP